MAFAARIIFTDLCAFFRPSPTELDAILVDASSPTPQQKAAEMHRHVPLLGISIKHLSLDPANRRPDRLVPELGGDALVLFDLFREEVQVSTPSSLDIVNSPVNTAVPLSLMEEKSLAWLAPLDLLGFNLNTLHSAALGNLTTGPVASRVKITGGKVTCHRVVRENGQYRQFELRSAPGAAPVGGRRSFGDLVQVDLTLPSVEENGGPQITSSSGKNVSILTSEDDSPVDLLVGNMTLDPALLSPGGSAATHFRWFYELLQSPPPPLDRVVPFVAPLGPSTATSPGICIMGFGEPA